ncbi:MAG: c-type cytochrome [Planctomycetes bacterium]|nr:c-type cytochrome [Planctomycetota bacterium]
MAIVTTILITALAGIRFLPLDAQGIKKAKKATPAWIWHGTQAQPNQTVYFRKEIDLKYRVVSAKLFGTCDNQMTVYINGKEAISSDDWEAPVFREVTDQFINPTKITEPVRNVIAVKAHNSDGPAGLVLRIVLENSKKETIHLVTDGSWRVTDQVVKGWQQADFNDSAWASATVVARLGAKPWNKINETALLGVAKVKKATATPIELIKVKKDYQVELLYSVPRQTQGSWVNLCVDSKGRLITSNQYGKLYRVTPPALIGAKASAIKIEELPVDIGEAHGLLWAFDSLYVVVNEGRKYKPRGLWRVTSSQKNDILDKKELLREMNGNGEHGPHAVILGPDRKSLYVLHGNHTKPVKTEHTTVPRIWGEDFLVPRLWDASGHAVGIMAPAGCIYKCDPDGKNWTLISVGYRNQFDAAFNRDGELFTYDSDMEWDMSLPWYRPTRVCHAVPGSEFGWRGGTGKMYEYHPDNLPPVVNVGPGSPCGVTFGYGAKFPAKYQDALFLCDWSYGKLYACHMTPDGASYKGELEEFLNGSPLPLTDAVINPKDGAMYFTIGGRNTMSGLYRVTYVGKESTEPPPNAGSAPSPALVARRKLESFYGKKDPQAVATAWPYLSSKDRFLRYAARTVLEFQDPKTWQEKALKEEEPIALTHAMIGLARIGDKALQARILVALNRVDFAKLSEAQKIDLLRAYQLAFVRMGAADDTAKSLVSGRLDALYPARTPETNVELCKLIAHLEVPGGVAKTLKLLAKAPTQEEQIEYALALRSVKTGWSLKERETYFNWFHKAANYRGGNSFHRFLSNIRRDAIASLSGAERANLKAALANVPTPAAPTFTFKKRPFVKKYTVNELAPIVEKNLFARDFAKGRNLFGEAKCFVCHRFNNEGGGTGPDLTIVSGRFGVRDLLESMIEPSKVVSDQYAAIVVTTTDGRQIIGRVVNLAGDNMMINTDMLDPNKLAGVNRNLVESITPSKVSMMPDGLLDTFTQEEILDLVAYLYSRGDRNHKMFRR